MKNKAFIVWGISGAGKDTQSASLVSYLREQGIKCPDYLSVGSLMREKTKNKQSFFASRVRNTIEVGALLPEFVPIWAWTSWLNDVAEEKIYYVMNGVARKPHESSILVSALQYLGVEDVYFINLKISPMEVVRRLLKRGRKDDTQEKIEKRIQWYKDESTQALIDAKKTDAHVIDLNGEGTIEEVFERIKKSLNL